MYKHTIGRHDVYRNNRISEIDNVNERIVVGNNVPSIRSGKGDFIKGDEWVIGRHSDVLDSHQKGKI